MFNLFRKSQPRQPTAGLAHALTSDGLPPGLDPASLAVVEQKGSYSGRRVTYFRVFDPVRVAEHSVQVRDFADLDTHPELVLGSGHLEQNGAVVLARHDRTPIGSAYVAVPRAEANRAHHGDDEQFVFPEKPA